MKNKSFLISFATALGNLGCVFTTSTTPKRALMHVSSLGINPGGQAAIFPCDDAAVNEAGRDKLITPAQMRALSYVSTTDSLQHIPVPLQHLVYGMRMHGATLVCEHCNGKFADV